MGKSYTPGLRVTACTRIYKERRLPLKGQVLVEAGERVTAQDVVAQTFLPGDVYPLNVANKLGIPAGQVAAAMKVPEGDGIAEGELLAETKGFFGLFKGRVHSPVSGTVENVSSVTGQVLLRKPPLPVSITAYVDGIIKEVLPEEGVVIDTAGALIQGIFGIGGEVTGQIRVAVDGPADELSPEHITDADKDAVLVGGSKVGLAALKKAISVGASAVVVGGFDDEDLRKFLGFELGVAVTGSEQLGITLILTEGFGAIQMAERTFGLLKDNEGRRASANGATQIRAGVIRPEVVIVQDVEPDTVEVVDLAQSGGIDIGRDVRGIREPYFGRIGAVTALPNELQQVESETMVRVLEVTFAGGESATLPRANVEAIEN